MDKLLVIKMAFCSCLFTEKTLVTTMENEWFATTKINIKSYFKKIKMFRLILDFLVKKEKEVHQVKMGGSV